MPNFLLLAIDFMKFWYIDAPKGLIDYFSSLNASFLKLFSLRLLLATFFKPWKNEYRQGLVGFSMIMGMAIKSMIIAFDLIVFFVLVVCEIFAIFLFITWPVITILLLFIPNL